ncbi:MAG: hypothetical protein AB1418_04115 [Pseudomonadota bacterium]
MAFATLGIDLVAKIATFEENMRKARDAVDSLDNRFGVLSSTLKGFGAGLAGAFSFAGLASLAKQGIDAADALNDLSDRTGVSVKDLASFKLAAQLADTSLENLGAGIGKLTRTIGDAGRGNKAAAEALAELGIRARDPKEAFLQLADAVQGMEDPTRRAALLNAVLGRSYEELLPLLLQGGESLRQAAKDAESYADAMARLAPDAGAFNDNLDRLKQESAGASAAVLERLVPSLTETSKQVKELLDKDQGFLALGRAILGVFKLPSDLIFSNITPAATAAERVKELEEELVKLKATLKDVSPGGAKSSVFFRSIFGDPAEIQQQITVVENQIEAMKKFGEQIYGEKKDDQDKDATDTSAYAASLQAALEKAFSTNPLDKFLAKLKDRRQSIASEYAALKAEMEGGPAGAASSLDVSLQLTLGRSALESGDADAAEAAIKRAKDLFRDLAAQESTAGFEKSYFLRELERLETDVVDKSVDLANAGNESFRARLEQLNAEAATLKVEIDEKLVLRQADSIYEQVQKRFAEKPLTMPIVPSVSTTGLQSVDLATAATQYGGRR